MAGPRATLSPFEQAEITRRIVDLIGRAGSIRAMAAKTGFSESVIRKWRNGRTIPSYANLVQLARAMGVPTQWLTSGDPDAAETPPLLYDNARQHPYWQRRADGSRLRQDAAIEDVLPLPDTDALILWDLEMVTSDPFGRVGDVGLIDGTATVPQESGYYLVEDGKGPWLCRLERAPDGILLALPGPRARWVPLAGRKLRILGRLRAVITR
jgi:transcriptional regulator with XRE-family HTH domain